MCLVLISLIQPSESLNQVVNYNEFTMWMFNYFRAYMCGDMMPDSVCDGLAGAREGDAQGDDIPTATTNNQVGNSFLPNAEGGEGGIFGMGVFGVGGGVRRLRGGY